MIKLFASVALLAVLASSTASAAEKILTLAVQNMVCDACPLVVRKSLEAVPGSLRLSSPLRTRPQS
jgi:periplasmic mercuric ion binding protein